MNIVMSITSYHYWQCELSEWQISINYSSSSSNIASLHILFHYFLSSISGLSSPTALLSCHCVMWPCRNAYLNTNWYWLCNCVWMSIEHHTHADGNHFQLPLLLPEFYFSRQAYWRLSKFRYNIKYNINFIFSCTDNQKLSIRLVLCYYWFLVCFHHNVQLRPSALEII